MVTVTCQEDCAGLPWGETRMESHRRGCIIVHMKGKSVLLVFVLLCACAEHICNIIHGKGAIF
jgi:hypothetical protein